MSGDMFLKIEGIDGESIDDRHPGEIDITSWTFGMVQSGTTHVATGSGGGKVSVQDMHFTKLCDKSTPALMKHCCDGKHIPSATVTMRKAGGDDPVDYMVVKLKDIIVSSYQMSGSGGGDAVHDSFSLNFRQYEATYTQQEATGVAGAATSQGWDMAANIAYAT